MPLTISEAIAVNQLLDSLANTDKCSWEEMRDAGALLADKAHKALMAGFDGPSFRRALNRGQGMPGKGRKNAHS